MPFVATSALFFVLQQARISAPHEAHLCVETDSFALPTPTTAQSVPHPLQPWRTKDLVSGPSESRPRAPPFESVSRTVMISINASRARAFCRFSKAGAESALV